MVRGLREDVRLKAGPTRKFLARGEHLFASRGGGGRAVKRKKHFRDPVHGFVELPREVILPLIDTFEFQRLRRLTQLGTSSFTYPGAEHSRFQHSLGVAHLFCRLAQELERQGEGLSEEELLVGTCAALLHDIGHGPFSHALEGILGTKHHEDWTQAIILSSETETNTVLKTIDASLPKKVADVIAKRPPDRILVNMIASQLDVDRMDYLLRDSTSVGVSYGRYDVDRLIRMIRRDGSRLVVDERGLLNAQEFLFARYYMYWQVYFHPTTRGYEVLLKKAWQRAKELASSNALPVEGLPGTLRDILQLDGAEPSIMQYLRLDNHDVYVALKAWTDCDDKILSDLSRRLLCRDLLKPVDVTDAGGAVLSRFRELERIVRDAGFDPNYYVLEDRTSNVPYDYYVGEEMEPDKLPIYVRRHDGKLEEISKRSDAINAIARRRETQVRIYVPAECRDSVKRLFT